MMRNSGLIGIVCLMLACDVVCAQVDSGMPAPPRARPEMAPVKVKGGGRANLIGGLPVGQIIFELQGMTERDELPVGLPGNIRSELKKDTIDIEKMSGLLIAQAQSKWMKELISSIIKKHELVVQIRNARAVEAMGSQISVLQHSQQALIQEQGKLVGKMDAVLEKLEKIAPGSP